MIMWPLNRLEKIRTPYYYYDIALLEDQILTALNAAKKYDYTIHYAMKANHHPRILQAMKAVGFGLDCVSENELLEALNENFYPSKILLAGVGKTDREIEISIENSIGAIHAESIEELEVIEEIAKRIGKTANVALRINPDVKANTHPGITTGLSENKFGITINKIKGSLPFLKQLEHVNIIGLHFHIGSQIEDLSVFKSLALKVNTIWEFFIKEDFDFHYLNLGGGLGVDYYSPDGEAPSFESYFETFYKNLRVGSVTEIHFELGRSLVAQCGNLISKVLYVKKGEKKEFLILDAGMTELIRPALYNSYHQVDNLSSTKEVGFYDIVGPVCESSDSFAQKRPVAKAKRNDLIAIRSAGAYGQVMASNYNLRPTPQSVFSDELTSVEKLKKVV